MINRKIDNLAIDRVVELGTRCLDPDAFMALEQISEQIRDSVRRRKRDEKPTELTRLVQDHA